ncbi:MAG: DUF4294 domain-containing protein [Prevotellaceae bacterium]|jgi:hypothetical protein|nr:DUF4294 domain-containing protein [Prevotellaceae bacterium]
MKTFFTCFLLYLFAATAAAAAADESRPTLAYIAVDENGDTIPHVRLQPVYCFAKPKFKNARQERKYYQEYARMARNMKKVYPYAQLAKQTLAKMDAEFVLLKDDRAKKAYIRKVEKELFREFEQPLRKLTISQGRMLIKLVDRETGRTGYQIVKELKGGFAAFFWQSVAVLFDSSLKTQFDAEGQDKILEQLIILYESGLL